MNLIKINLNQTVSKAEKDFIDQEKKRWYTFYFICGFFIITIIWLIFINSRMSYIVNQRTNTINNIVESTKILKSDGKINLSKKDINNLYDLIEEMLLFINMIYYME